MSAPQGCTDDMGVVESFKEALKGRVGADRFRMWFTHGVGFTLESNNPDSPSDVSSHDGDDCQVVVWGGSKSNEALNGRASEATAAPPTLIVSVRGQFALERLKKNFLSEIRGAAMQACGSRMDVRLCLDEPAPHQVPLPLNDPDDGQTVPVVRVDGVVGIVEGTDTSERTAQGNPGNPGNPAGRPSYAGTITAASGATADGKPTRRRRSPRSLAHLMNEGSATTTSKRPGVTGARRGGMSSAGAPRLTQSTFLESGASGDAATSEPELEGEAGSGQGSASSRMTSANFIPGHCNRLAHTAMVMACQEPSSASPLFLCGPTGTGKTHLLAAIAEQLRRRHRMRRVIHLSAEQFTNDFISSVGNSGITAFRRRYREVDALLIDDVQFLGAKKATLREMLYTVETLASQGRPLIFSGSQAPTEIEGLTKELAGRMAAGLVCPLQPLDGATREQLLRRWVSERCQLEVPDALVEQISPLLAGDGRVISGIVNVINTLQRMFRRNPSVDELRQYASQLLRASQPLTTLSVIESAVCEAFQLPGDALRGKSQTRAVTGPRMLAMYLSRQLTSAAYAEIARHFGGRSHSTAIAAEQHVKTWLSEGGEVGRGRTAMSAREAIDRVESLLRSG